MRLGTKKIESLSEGKIQGEWLKSYKDTIVTQEEFNNLLINRNNRISLKNVCFVGCDLSNIDFSIVNEMEFVIMLKNTCNKTLDDFIKRVNNV